MTAEDAVAIAAKKARQLGMPWGPDATATPLWRLWPLPRLWRVVSRVPGELSETTVMVNERTREAFPRQVRVAHRFGVGGQD